MSTLVSSPVLVSCLLTKVPFSQSFGLGNPHAESHCSASPSRHNTSLETLWIPSSRMSLRAKKSRSQPGEAHSLLESNKNAFCYSQALTSKAKPKWGSQSALKKNPGCPRPSDHLISLLQHKGGHHFTKWGVCVNLCGLWEPAYAMAGCKRKWFPGAAN